MSRHNPLRNTLTYLYRRNRWMFDPSFYFSRLSSATKTPIHIDRPIFLLGVQGGGLTLISRILRRHEDVVSVSGSSDYWWGADEMQNVFWSVLPADLAGIKYRYPDRTGFTKPRGWLYAIDALLPYYRKTAHDATPKLQQEFTHPIRWSLRRFGRATKHPRFTDKSQVFTLKILLIEKLIRDAGSAPKFVLITRNPYALCYRSVKLPDEAPELKAISQQQGFNTALDYAAQHWANSMKTALEDGKKVKHFYIMSFEDFLKKPEQQLKQLCNFLELSNHSITAMLPREHHHIGLGLRPGNESKWYPLRADVNGRYLGELTQEHIDIVARHCESIADGLGYKRPRV